MGLESQSAINPCHKSRPIKADQPSIAWIKFITPSSSFGPSLECLALESAKISWIRPLSASLFFLDLALVIGLTGTCNGSLNACWFSSPREDIFNRVHLCHQIDRLCLHVVLQFVYGKEKSKTRLFNRRII